MPRLGHIRRSDGILVGGGCLNSCMTSQLIGVHPHPVAAFAERLDTRLEDVGQMGLTTMRPEEMRQTLVRLPTARAKEDGIQLALLACAEGARVGLEPGAADAGGFVARETRQTRREARSDLKLAMKLPAMPVLAAAM